MGNAVHQMTGSRNNRSPSSGKNYFEAFSIENLGRGTLSHHNNSFELRTLTEQKTLLGILSNCCFKGFLENGTRCSHERQLSGFLMQGGAQNSWPSSDPSP